MATLVETRPEAPQRVRYLLDRRDEDEKDRLNSQNTTVNVLRDGHILEPSIPKQNISRIADVATGTGIWLRDVAAELAAAGNTSPLELVGFDISPAQFPKSPAPGTKFVLADMMEEFPEEYHNSFDIVHIRFAVLTVDLDHIDGVVKNIVKLIKPGGYLQWTDYLHPDGGRAFYPDAHGLSGKEEGEMVAVYFAEQRYPDDITGSVAKALDGLPMEEAYIHDYSKEQERRPEIRDEIAAWHADTMTTLVQMVMVHRGISKEEITKTTDGYKVKAAQLHKLGFVFPMYLSTLVARKKPTA